MGTRWSTKSTAEHILEQAKAGVMKLKAASIDPHLVVVLVGDDPASHVYVRHKVAACEELGIRSTKIALPADVAADALLSEVMRLNRDASVHGILVQMPLPKHIDCDAVIRAIDPDKDVDGFHPINVGRLALGQPGLFPCTPMGVMALLKQTVTDLSGRRALVIGRSAIVGKPMAHLLLHANCTVTVSHSRTVDHQAVCREADIVIVAVGRPGLVDGGWLKPGSWVVDVGINEIKDPALAEKLLDGKRLDRFRATGRAFSAPARRISSTRSGCFSNSA